MNNQETNNSGTPESQDRQDSIGERELKSMLAEMRDADLVVLEIAEQALLEPIPDLNDEEAVADYNQRMAMIKNLVQEYVARSTLLAEMEARIDDRIQQTSS